MVFFGGGTKYGQQWLDGWREPKYGGMYIGIMFIYVYIFSHSLIYVFLYYKQVARFSRPIIWNARTDTDDPLTP